MIDITNLSRGDLLYIAAIGFVPGITVGAALVEFLMWITPRCGF